MISTRFAVPVVALLALAAVPTVIHSYMPSTISDGRSVRDIPLDLADQRGTQTKRRATWGEDRFGSTDWSDRSYGGTAGVKFFIGRSLDPKRLYHHPELALDYGETYGAGTTIRLPQRSDIPVHVLRGAEGNARRLALYALHYEDQYVEDPILFQLRTSFRLLFTRRQPMTLFFLAQDLRADETVETSRAAALLLSAIDAFEKQK
jgi:hypothetical protein